MAPQGQYCFRRPSGSVLKVMEPTVFVKLVYHYRREESGRLQACNNERSLNLQVLADGGGAAC